jgi:uncharacterized protein with HEPN domain
MLWMPEDERLRLEAIRDRISLINSWVAEMNEADFVSHLMARDAVALSILVIGETARRLSDITRSAAPEVPWPAVISLRNRIAHGYETVDHVLVWQIVQQDLPGRDAAVRRILTKG